MEKFNIFMQNLQKKGEKTLGIDRVAHCLVCVLVTVVTALLLGKTEPETPSWLLGMEGAVTGLCLGYAKEKMDVRFDGGDFAADCAGCVLGWLLCWGIV